jgi:hypothetical protein
MITKPSLALLLLLSWLWLSGEVAAAPVRNTEPEQVLPEVDNLQQLLSSGTDAQPKDATEVDQLQPYGVAPDVRIKPEKQPCESLEVIAVSCEPAPGSPLSAFPVVLNTIHPYRTISS